jgi:two-component system NtrC family sensor kinase
LDTKPLALIIEDHEDQCLVFTTALEQAGYQTEAIMDGTVARQRLTEIVPSIIVLDLHIPGVRGDTLLSQIRSDERLAQTRVLLATADASMADSLRSQTDLVLLKPISFSQLSLLASRFNKY